MPSLRVSVLFLFILAGPLPVRGQNQIGSSPISIVYQEAKLSDEDFASLIRILALEPESAWPSEQITAADNGKLKFIENHYNISSLSNPLATNELIQVIESANPGQFDTLRPGQSLRIPPIPKHVYRQNDRPRTAIRLLPPGGRSGVGISGMEGTGDIEKQVSLSDDRDATITAKQISDSRPLVELAWSSDKPILPPGIHAFDKNGDVILDLHDSSDPCDASQNWLATSPALVQLKARLARVLSDPTQKQQLLQSSESIPLVIVDWVTPLQNHGKKVASVARGVLAQLGLSELKVQEVDLNPTNNRVNLTGIFEDFIQHQYCLSEECSSEGSRGIIDESRKWLKTNPTVSTNTIPVKQLVLEAVLWKYFKQQTAFVNMSFSINSSALEVLQANYLSTSHSFGVAAANDAGWPESSAGVPQRAATLYTNFVNVTYANQDGKLIGGYSNQMSNMIVSVVGQGCGFDFDAIKPTDSGTSFATPYVAVSAWIKALLDKVDAADMRKKLITASFLSASLKGIEVESGGLFDLPALIAPEAYLLFGSGTPIKLRRGVLTLQYKTAPVNGVQLEATYPFQAGEGVSISFIRTGDRLTARIRSFRSGTPPLPLTETTEREVVKASLAAIDDSGVPIQVGESDFGVKYVRVVF
jgi:hypothetical protein